MHSPGGSLHLVGKALAWGTQPGDTGSPAADRHLDLALLAPPATGGLVPQERRCGDGEPAHPLGEPSESVLVGVRTKAMTSL